MGKGGVLGLRERHSLDGVWSFAHDSDGIWRQAVVPSPWQALFSDLRDVSGRATYRRDFALPDLRGRAAVLHFGAVSYSAEVRVNGTLIGQHEGGYLPFDIAIPADLLRPTNALEVRCHLPDGSCGFAEIHTASKAGTARSAASGNRSRWSCVRPATCNIAPSPPTLPLAP